MKYVALAIGALLIMYGVLGLFGLRIERITARLFGKKSTRARESLVVVDMNLIAAGIIAVLMAWILD